MVFCNEEYGQTVYSSAFVTILILIDGFLQWGYIVSRSVRHKSHNPYFNRWFSAIDLRTVGASLVKTSHNPYFNRWFSAIAGR